MVECLSAFVKPSVLSLVPYKTGYKPIIYYLGSTGRKITIQGHPWLLASFRPDLVTYPVSKTTTYHRRTWVYSEQNKAIWITNLAEDSIYFLKIGPEEDKKQSDHTGVGAWLLYWSFQSKLWASSSHFSFLQEKDLSIQSPNFSNFNEPTVSLHILGLLHKNLQESRNLLQTKILCQYSGTHL